MNWEDFVPEECRPFVHRWLDGTCRVRVVAPRKRKLGDYCFKDGQHQITLNRDLPPWLFFHVLSHEIAHLHQRQQFGPRVRPHGPEWKTCFAKLLLESAHLYPETVRTHLLRNARNPKATTAGVPELMDLLRGQTSNGKLLREIEEGTSFWLNKRVFEKGPLQRTRYLCTDLRNGKSYLVPGAARIEILQE